MVIKLLHFRPRYANEIYAKTRNQQKQRQDFTVAAKRIGLPALNLSLKNTGPLNPWGPLKVQIYSESQRCWDRRSQSLPKTGTGQNREALGAGTGTSSMR